MKKCYSKRILYTIPQIKCSICDCDINKGEEVCIVAVTWGNGITTCRKCYNEFEIDWSLHEDEGDEE